MQIFIVGLAVVASCLAPMYVSPDAPATLGETNSTTPGCSGTLVPNVLVVDRRHGIPIDVPAPYAPDLHRVVASRRAVHRLYSNVCNLSPVDLSPPPSCPPNSGITYTLTFRHSSRVALQVTAQATGCQWLLVGNNLPTGPVYWLTARFWKLLGAALHIKPKLLHAASP